ncbi:MAG: hypothetical protein ABF975_01300 [Liquorilactobacillus hordei]|uniref:hypothetical protein n=1 Tax=Liquorilactobacillus hordei TaxID=468911 RepID=UPI0039EC9175
MREIKFRAWDSRLCIMSDYVTAIQNGDTQGTPSSVNVIVNGNNETWDIEHDNASTLKMYLEDTGKQYEEEEAYLEKIHYCEVCGRYLE